MEDLAPAAKRYKREKRQKVVVRTPASTANLGPGFDTLGMAVDIWNEIVVERSVAFSLTMAGEGVDRVVCEVDPETGETAHLVMRSIRRGFEHAGETPMPKVSVHCRNSIPVCSGFGSSSAAIAGGLVAALVLAGKQVDVSTRKGAKWTPEWSSISEDLLQLANEIEGHPDNVAPAIYGGIQLCVELDRPWRGNVFPTTCLSRRMPTPDGMRLVVYVPNDDARFSFGSDKTEAMRGLLAKDISRKDAVFNIQRTALLIDSLHRGNWDFLGVAMEDALHQPQRGSKAFPHLRPMIQAAIAAGAHGAFLSGAGPTVLAICSGAHGDVFTQCSDERLETAVADAMRAAGEALPTADAIWGKGKFYIVSPTNLGTHVIHAEPPFSDNLATFGNLPGQSL